MKYFLIVMCCFVFCAVKSQTTPTTIVISLPLPDGNKIQKVLPLPLRDTTIVVKSGSEYTYKYSINCKKDTMYVKCVFSVSGKESTCDFKVQLKTHSGEIVPQRQQQSALLKLR